MSSKLNEHLPTSTTTDAILDASWLDPPPAHEVLAAVIRWHFDPATGSSFWLERAEFLDFDPIRDITELKQLTLFPNIVDELRDVPVNDLIPRGYGPDAGQPFIGESGGTTGAPKRLLWMPDTLARATDWHAAGLRRHGKVRPGNWLCIGPSGPHMAATLIRETAARFGAMCFLLDMDPRWATRCQARGAVDELKLYVEHIIDQAEWVLRSQDIAVIYSTPALLEGLCAREGLGTLINETVDVIGWGGTKIDLQERERFREDVFPNVRLVGGYAGTMTHGGMIERPGLPSGSPAVFDPPSPFVMFSVVDPTTLTPVPYGERGQLLTHHVSKGLFLPNNLERDTAIRVKHGMDRAGDAIADVQPMTEFQGKTLTQSIY